MRWVIAFALVAAFAATGARAQTNAVCGRYQAQWDKVSGGTNVAAMNRVIATIPDLCADLKDQARARRDEVETPTRHVAAAPHSAPPSAAERLRSAMRDPNLKAAFDIEKWICGNVSSTGFDLSKAYASFPGDHLALQEETKTPDKSQEHVVVVDSAKGDIYKVEYRYQIQTSDNTRYGFQIFISSLDYSYPIFASVDQAKEWLSTIGETKDGQFGPETDFGPVSPVINSYPLTIQVWNPGGFPISVNWFSAGGLRFLDGMCKTR